MKIAFMLRSLHERGGINVYTTNIIDNLLRIAQDTEFIFIYRYKSEQGRYANYSNVKEIVCYFPTKLFWDQIAVPYILLKEKVDLIYNPKLSIPLFTKCKKLLMIHGAEQFEVKHAFKWHDRIYTRIAMPLYARFADKIITTTETGIIDIAKHLGIKKEKFYFAYEGVHSRFKVLSPIEMHIVQQKYQLPKRFFLFVGGITPLKNFPRVLSAFDSISHLVEHKLVVVGFKRFKFQREFALADRMLQGNKIIFSGFVHDDDLPAFYNLAAALIFPSLYEGFGLPVLEAMACGCPVIATNTGCTKEVTADAALLVDPYNVKDIAEKIFSIVKDLELRNKLIDKGLKRANQFSWEKCAKETLEIFRSLVDNSNVKRI